MRIDRNTETREFAPFAAMVSKEDVARLKAAAVKDRFGESGFYGMTVGQLTTVISGDIRPLLDSGGRTVFDEMRVQAFKDFIDELCAALRGLTLPPTPESVRMASGTMSSTFAESVYLFTRSYFGLPSFKEADRVLVSEYLLARKDDYNRQVVERNASAMAKGGGR